MTVHVGPGDDPPIATLDELENRLEQIRAELLEPTLVQLTSQTATMHIGLGNPDYSVALYLDDERQPWGSHGTETEVADLAFLKGDHRYEFYAREAIPIGDALAAATEFVTNDKKPTSIDWVREGG